MKIAALALDYDGTVAVDGVLDPTVRVAIAEARRRGIIVILVTGRRLAELREVAGDLTCFDAVVGENGAVIEFPATGRHQVVGHPPTPAFLEELRRRGVPFAAGESVVEADADWAGPILDVIRALEQPLILAFNRDRLMVLPQSVAKSTGLRHALLALRVSIHNTLGIGNAENDHDLLDACEVGLAVEWGSKALCEVADRVLTGNGPGAVAGFIRRVSQEPWVSAGGRGRRRIVLGRQPNGDEISLGVRGRTILIAGEPGSGKSWLAGLVCEQSILHGYSVCIIDPEGDYRSLEGLPGVIRLGGSDPPPHAHQLLQALRHPDLSVIIDLSKISHQAKCEYVPTLLRLLLALRRTTGLPHQIVIDEAHHFLNGAASQRLIDPELAGYVLVTSRVSRLDAEIRAADGAVVMVTRETDPDEAKALLELCRPGPCATASIAVLQDLEATEAAMLPDAEEARGEVRRFRLGPRLT